jgi:hypothetical protein
MFHFVVRHLRWAARVPGLPQLFDALLVVGTLLFRRPRLAAMELLELEVLKMPGVQLKAHRFGGIEFVREEGRELGHVHGNGLLDVAVGRMAASPLLAEGRVRPHHVFPDSKWVSFQITSEADVPFAIQLLKMAHQTELRLRG